MRVAERYHLDRVVGRGGMGEVWRATDEVLDRPVAVKLLKPGGADSEAVTRFRREAHAGAVVNNPHVVAVHDFGRHEDGYFLVMELVDGRTLAAELQCCGQFGPPAAARITAQVANGLAAAHHEGIIHRDVKPANLLITCDGTVKVADFGIARLVDEPDDTAPDGRILGTSLYVAPERAQAIPAGPEADIYSLGCVLYHLLSGSPPFQADTPSGVLHQHIHCPPQPDRVHHSFRPVLSRMLDKEPVARPTAAEVADWCRELCDDQAPSPALAEWTPTSAAAIDTCALAARSAPVGFGSVHAGFGEGEPPLGLSRSVVTDGPVDLAQAHMRPVQPQRRGRKRARQQLVEPFER